MDFIIIPEDMGVEVIIYDKKDYIVEYFMEGFFCRNCGSFNGDAKVFLFKCRSCNALRPKKVTT